MIYFNEENMNMYKKVHLDKSQHQLNYRVQL